MVELRRPLQLCSGRVVWGGAGMQCAQHLKGLTDEEVQATGPAHSQDQAPGHSCREEVARRASKPDLKCPLR